MIDALRRDRGAGKRLSPLRRTLEAGEFGGAFGEFIQAVAAYRTANPGAMPTATEYFELLLFLGYRKVAPRAAAINDVEDPDDVPPPNPVLDAGGGLLDDLAAYHMREMRYAMPKAPKSDTPPPPGVKGCRRCCGRRDRLDRLLCQECRLYMSGTQRRQRERAAAAGICTTCLLDPIDVEAGSLATCKHCKAERVARRAAKKAELMTER